MLRHITHCGKELPVSFNVLTLLDIADAYNTDLTGIQEVFKSFKTTRDTVSFIAKVGAIALTEGARRTAEGGEYKRYTIDDLCDMLTVDMALAEQLLDALFSSMNAPQVFPNAAQAKPPKKKHK